MLQTRYLGAERAKRKIRRMNEKKFVFDWDAGDDTSRDYNPIYAERHEVQLFGRGHLAGIDVAAQRLNKSQIYQDILEERRTTEEKAQVRTAAKCCSLRTPQYAVRSMLSLHLTHHDRVMMHVVVL